MQCHTLLASKCIARTTNIQFPKIDENGDKRLTTQLKYTSIATVDKTFQMIVCTRGSLVLAVFCLPAGIRHWHKCFPNASTFSLRWHLIHLRSLVLESNWQDALLQTMLWNVNQLAQYILFRINQMAKRFGKLSLLQGQSGVRSCSAPVCQKGH